MMIFPRTKWRLGDLIVGFLSSYAVVWIIVSLLFVFGGYGANTRSRHSLL
jgi:hypothetical protein